MALTSYRDVAYLAPRLAAWTLLFLAALFDAVRHRQTKRRGFQLQRGIVICLFAYVVQDTLLLSSSAMRRSDPRGSGDVWIAYLVFGNLADALFMLLLLLIAAGYCITRDNLGPYAQKVLVTPAAYFLAKTLVDIVTDIYGGQDEILDPTEFSPVTWLVLYIAQVVSIMAFLLALIFIFEIVNKEVEAITKPREGIVGARDVENGGTGTESSRPEGGHGHNVALPPEAIENGQSLNDIYAEVTGDDHDAPKTVEDRIQHRTKVLLMRQFSWAAAVCVCCYIAALLVPMFLSAPDQEDEAALIVIIVWNGIQWLFLAGLCFIFRVRDTNPYLLLDEDGSGLDTDFSSGEIRTELGLLSSTSDKTLDGPEGIDHNFSIGGEEDEEEAAKGRARLMSRHREKSSID